MENVFVLKDQEGNYVSANSICYDSETKKVVYSFSKTLTNGFWNYSSRQDAENGLDKLLQSNARFNLPKTFHIEEIDMREVCKYEHTNGTISSLPFVNEYFDIKDNEHWGWIIRDSKRNIVHANSVKKWDSKTWMYISSKTFSPESRGYVNLNRAECAIDKLYSRCKKMGLSETFKLEYVNVDKLIKQYKYFDGENLVIVEKLVA